MTALDTRQRRTAAVVRIALVLCSPACSPARRPSPSRSRRSRTAEPAGRIAAQRSRVLRDARPQRPRLHQPVQRHVLRREDRRHRDHPARRPDGHRRGGPPVAHAGAVGPDPQGDRPEGGQSHKHDHVSCCGTRRSTSTPGWSSRPKARASASPSTSTSRCPRNSRGGRGSTSSSCRRNSSSARTSRTASPGSSRAIPRGRHVSKSGRHEDPRSSRATRRSTIGAGTTTWRSGRWPWAGRSCSLPRIPSAGITIEAASGELQLLDGRNLAQNGWFIVRSLLQANATGKVAEWVVRPQRHPELDADPGRRLLAGRVSPVAEEGGGHRTGRERHRPRNRIALRGDRRRHAGRAGEGEGPALGPVPPIQVRHGGFQRREPSRAVLHPVRAAEDRDVPDRPERVRHDLAPDGGRLVSGADGPHDGQRGVPRVARPAAHGRRAAGAAELPALRRLPDGAVDRDEVQAPRADPGAGRRRLVRRGRLRHPGRLPRRHDHQPRRHLGDLQAAARRDATSIRPPASSTFIARTASRTSCSRSSTAPSPWRRSTGPSAS